MTAASTGAMARRRRKRRSPGLALPLLAAAFLLSSGDRREGTLGWAAMASQAASSSSLGPPPAGGGAPLPPRKYGVVGDGDTNPIAEGGSMAGGGMTGEAPAADGEASTAAAPPETTAAESGNDSTVPAPQQSDNAPLIDDASAAIASAAFGGYSPGQGGPATAMAAATASHNMNAKPADQGTGGGGWFGKILGGNKDKGNEQRASAPRQNGPGILPPPPPPPPPMDGRAGANKLQQKGPWGSQQQPQQQQSPGSYYPNNQYYDTYNDPNAAYQNLLLELDESTLREMTLTHQIHNLTAYISTLTSESDTLVNKVDVLTERLADSESNWNYVHNRNLELDANCTSLGNLVKELQEQVDLYEGRVGELQGAKGEDEAKIQELRAELRKVTDELEKLACLVETERFEAEKSTYLEEFARKQLAKRKKKKGFFAWLFGWDAEVKVTKEQSELEATERHRAAQELARSTLLHALQTERTNVDELETTVATLQRNNSAIMDVVSSRDSLISELNDRVAVFEEDKMVLKAALRQLQLEIKEEAPKTQQLADDLDAAREREEGLKAELEELVLDQEAEREDWEEKMAVTIKEQNTTREELELISLYVDQLEDRLANFAIARKELEVFEKECERLEAEAQKYETEAGEYKLQVEELEKEQSETKSLLDDLVRERADTRIKIGGLNAQIDQWKKRLDEAERQNAETKSMAARQLFLRIEEEKASWNQNSVQQMEEERRAWQAEKEQELQQLLEHERVNWESSSAQEFAVRLGKEQSALAEAFEGRLQREKAALEGNLNEEWGAKLEQQRLEMETRLQQEAQSRLDEARASWEEMKERELSERLEEERSLWETEAATQTMNEKSAAASVALEDEVERAAAKVFARLESSGVSFGGDVVEEMTSFDPELKERLFGSVPDNSVDGETEDTSEENSDGMIDTNPALPKERAQPQKVDESKDGDHLEETEKKVAPMSSDQKKPSQQNQQKAVKRSVPFRSMRKAFSRATGMHGLFTPSTVQLRQLEMRKRRKQQKKGKSPPRTSGHSKRSDDDDDTEVMNDTSNSDSVVSAEGDDASSSTTEASSSSSMNGDAEGGMPSHPTAVYSQQRYADGTGSSDMGMANDSWGNHHPNAADSIDAEGFASSSWGTNPAGEAGDFMEPPPLPEIDDPLMRT